MGVRKFRSVATCCGQMTFRKELRRQAPHNKADELPHSKSIHSTFTRPILIAHRTNPATS